MRRLIYLGQKGFPRDEFQLKIKFKKMYGFYGHGYGFGLGHGYYGHNFGGYYGLGCGSRFFF